MLTYISSIANFLFDPQHTVLTMLVVFTFLVFLVAMIPDNKIVVIRSFSLLITFVPLFWSLYLWALFDASGHSLQLVVTLNRLHLSFGVDAVSLSLTVLTAALFPLCVILMRTVSGIMSFLLLEIVVLGALNVLDLLGFYILFEASLILLFLMIARTPFGSIEAAYKIVLYTMAGSLLLLPVIFLMYTECGSTNLLYILCARDNVLSLDRQMILGWGLLTVFAVKIPLMPVHLWLPEAHVAASVSGSVILAGVLLKLGIVGIYRFLIPTCPIFVVHVYPIIACLCFISFLFASLSTIRQIDLKKIIAYSSISHMALITQTLFTQDSYSVYSATYYMIAHGIVSPALFLLTSFLYERYHTKYLPYLFGVGSYMPLFSLIFFIFCCGNMSFPLTPSFIPEVLCLANLFSVHELFAYVFCITQVLTAVYNLWAFNRVVHGYSAKSVLFDLTRFEFAIVLPLLAGFFWLSVKPMA